MSSSSSLDGTPFSVCWTRVKTRWTTAWSRSEKNYDLSDDSQKVGFLQEAAQLLSSLPSAVEREIYGRHAAETAGVSPEAVAQEVKRPSSAA